MNFKWVIQFAKLSKVAIIETEAFQSCLKAKFELISPDQLFEGLNLPKYYWRFFKTFYQTIVVLAGLGLNNRSKK